MNDELPTILPDHVVRMVARDGWRRQMIADLELEKKLAALRACGSVSVPAAVTSSPRSAPQQDLFGAIDGA